MPCTWRRRVRGTKRQIGKRFIRSSDKSRLPRRNLKRIGYTLDYKIRYLPNSVMKDYEGMNYYAAKEIGFKPLPKKNEIFILRTLSKKDKYKTILHERLEADKMKKGMRYWKAHGKVVKESTDKKTNRLIREMQLGE